MRSRRRGTGIRGIGDFFFKEVYIRFFYFEYMRYDDFFFLNI